MPFVSALPSADTWLVRVNTLRMYQHVSYMREFLQMEKQIHVQRPWEETRVRTLCSIGASTHNQNAGSSAF